MPRVRIDVSEAWLDRLRQVLPAAVDALTGWEHQIDAVRIEGKSDAETLLDQLHGQIIDLRRSIQAVKVIF